MKSLGSVSKIVQSRGDRFVESKELVKIVNEIRPLKKSNKKLDGFGFMQRLVFGMSDCWYFRGCINNLGYGIVSSKKAHRISYEFFKGKIPAGMSVLHKCDIRNCVNPDHLFIGTQLDNMRDCKQKGRLKSPVPRFAEKNPMSKINRGIVSEMKKIRNETGMSHKKIAKIFNISTMTAYRAVEGISWK